MDNYVNILMPVYESFNNFIISFLLGFCFVIGYMIFQLNCQNQNLNRIVDSVFCIKDILKIYKY